MGSTADVSAFRGAVDGLLTVDLAALTSVELAAVLVELEVQRRRLAAVDHRLLAEMNERGTAGEYGRASTVDLVVTLLRVTPAEAEARVAQAGDLGPRRSLTGEPLAPILPATADASRAGDISPGHVSMIARCLDRIPAEIAYEVNPVAERFLISAARHEHPAALARTAEALLLRVDPDGRAPRDEEIERRREFTLRPHADGSADGRGLLTPSAAEAMRTVLDPLSAPAPAADGLADQRTPGQRRHDALHELALRALRSDDLSGAAGIPVTILATTTLAELRTGEGLARTGHGDLWPIRSLLDLAGDAAIVPVVLNDFGGVLAYGRTRRLATKSQRLALAARDGGCCFPDCARPPAWTEAHHIIEWEHGGLTDIDNMCLLCKHHHREFQRRGWTVRINHDEQVPEWIPPPFIDPHQQPRRNTTHHHLDFDYRTPEAVA